MSDLQLPTLDAVKAAFADLAAANDFWDAHREEFMQRFPEQFVVVVDGRVVASDPELAGILAAISKLGLARQDVWLRYFTAEPRAMIL